MASPIRLFSDRTGAAAAEMALVLPILLAIMFGCFELGHYFLSEHVVQKAVRDASRYAGRLPMSSYPACSPTPIAEANIQKIARTGIPEDGGTARLRDWVANSSVTVTVTCYPPGTYAGIYSDFPDGAPVVTVAAHVPYPPLFGVFSFTGSTVSLKAASQSAVFGA